MRVTINIDVLACDALDEEAPQLAELARKLAKAQPSPANAQAVELHKPRLIKLECDGGP